MKLFHFMIHDDGYEHCYVVVRAETAEEGKEILEQYMPVSKSVKITELTTEGNKGIIYHPSNERDDSWRKNMADYVTEPEIPSKESSKDFLKTFVNIMKTI